MRNFFDPPKNPFSRHFTSGICICLKVEKIDFYCIFKPQFLKIWPKFSKNATPVPNFWSSAPKILTLNLGLFGGGGGKKSAILRQLGACPLISNWDSLPPITTPITLPLRNFQLSDYLIWMKYRLTKSLECEKRQNPAFNLIFWSSTSSF